MKGSPIITAPKHFAKPPPYILTGNEWVKIPTLHSQTGALLSIALLHDQGSGLLELTGKENDPLLTPHLSLPFRKDISFSAPKLSWIAHWLPQIEWENSYCILRITVAAPLTLKGFIYRMEVRAKQKISRVTAGISGSFREASIRCFQPTPLSGYRRIQLHQWTNSLCLEAVSSFPVAALAFHPATSTETPFRFLAGRKNFSALSPQRSLQTTKQKDALRYQLTSTFSLAQNERATLDFYVGTSRSQDGAATTALAMHRQSASTLFQKTKQQLLALCPKQTNLLNPALQHKAKRNLLFSFFFSQGKAIDTGKFFAVTSCSPLYYVSGAFWERDTFLWNFPAQLILDPQQARQNLLRLFTLHYRNAGDHAHYINGEVLYPGFELDQLCAYAVALQSYIAKTKDNSILHTDTVRTVFPTLFQKLMQKKHEKIALFETTLLPSDDPTPYPYVIYNNVLVICFLKVWAKVFPAKRKEALMIARSVKQAIWKYGVVESRKRKLFAYAADLKGHHWLYDDPAGSLLLLPYLGFCKEDNPVYQQTMHWILSPKNRYWCQGKYAGPTCAHYPTSVALMTLISQLLTHTQRKQALSRLAKLDLDHGLACESFDPRTGKVATGAAFAALAGFLSWALLKGEKSPWQKL